MVNDHTHSHTHKSTFFVRCIHSRWKANLSSFAFKNGHFCWFSFCRSTFFFYLSFLSVPLHYLHRSFNTSFLPNACVSSFHFKAGVNVLANQQSKHISVRFEYKYTDMGLKLHIYGRFFVLFDFWNSNLNLELAIFRGKKSTDILHLIPMTEWLSAVITFQQ